jgi:thymidylate kinase
VNGRSRWRHPQAKVLRIVKTVDTTIFFSVPVDVALTRHENSGEHQTVDDVAMNRKWLDVLADSYAKNASEFPNCISIDGLQDSDETERVIRDVILSL